MTEIIASAPGRCGIIGNPSDMYGGHLVSCSVPLRATCRVTAAEEWDLPEGDHLLWEAACVRYEVGPCRVRWGSAVPRSSGLAGSTALLAAMLACVWTLAGREIDDKVAFAEELRDIEANEAGVVCGFQDAYMVTLGRLRGLDFAGKHPVGGGPVGRVQEMDAPLPFLLVTTGVERLSGSVHGPIRDRWLAGDSFVWRGIERIAELGRIGEEALLASDWASLAEAMKENQALVRELGGSGEPVDELISLCEKHGALAAKLAGAGMGGTVIALTDDAAGLEARLRGEGYSVFCRPEVVEGLQVVGSQQ